MSDTKLKLAAAAIVATPILIIVGAHAWGGLSAVLGACLALVVFAWAGFAWHLIYQHLQDCRDISR